MLDINVVVLVCWLIQSMTSTADISYSVLQMLRFYHSLRRRPKHAAVLVTDELLVVFVIVSPKLFSSDFVSETRSSINQAILCRVLMFLEPWSSDSGPICDQMEVEF